MFPNAGDSGQQAPRMGCNPRIAILIVVVLMSLMSYMGNVQTNPVTGERQHLTMTTDQEIALGLQAAPDMINQYGGEVERGQDADIVQRVGRHLVDSTAAHTTDYKFDFHLLSDPQTINAFALPGGQVFITRGLLSRLQTEGQLAGVLGHEIGHVVGRHGAEHMAKSQLLQGLTAAAVMATYDPNNPSSAGKAAMAQMIGQLMNLKYGRDDENEADEFGVKFMSEAGYNPQAMLGVMTILEQATSGNRQPEIMSTHPNPGNRKEHIEEVIKRVYPNGVPGNLVP